MWFGYHSTVDTRNICCFLFASCLFRWESLWVYIHSQWGSKGESGVMNIINVAVDLIQILFTFLDTGINFLQGQITMSSWEHIHTDRQTDRQTDRHVVRDPVCLLQSCIGIAAKHTLYLPPILKKNQHYDFIEWHTQSFGRMDTP